MEIVLAEDHADIRAMLAARLRREGHMVREAETGAEAMALIRENRPDLLVTDYVMPELDGVDVIRAARRQGDCETLDAILYTAYPEDDRIRRLLSEPRVSYVQKGKPSALVRMVGRIAASSRTR